MSNGSLIPLTERADDSSGGLFERHCTTLCSPLQLIDVAPDGNDWSAALNFSQGNVHWFHGAKLIEQTPQSREDQTALLWRFFCHYLVDQIPDAGLVDACQLLRDVHEYYTPTDSAEHFLPQTSQHTARMGVRSVRPDFTVEGE
jgi:hypothetical protein